MLYNSSRVSTITAQFNNQISLQTNTILSNEDAPILNCDQNLACIWYCDDDLNEDVQIKMTNRLAESFTYFRTFNDLGKFTKYLFDPLVMTEIYFIITSEESAENVCRIAKNRPQCQKVYQFQPNALSINDSHVFTNIDKLFLQISNDIRANLRTHQSFPVSETSSGRYRESVDPPPCSVYNSKTTEQSFQYWKKESPKFFLFQILNRFLTRLECDYNRSLEEMIQRCRQDYINNTKEIQKIDDVEKNYKDNDPIWYYTKDSFLFRSVGRAFRSEDFEHIFIFRRYIIDLHLELDKHARNHGTQQNVLTLYRGKKLRTSVLQQLIDNVGGLVSMNGFLSTTCEKCIATKLYAGPGENRPGYESVVFELCVHKTTITNVYADICLDSQFQSENEVLFTIGSVWQINSVKKTDGLYWIIKLSSCSDVDLRIVQSLNELADDSIMFILGDVLFELEQYTKAENFYYKMLQETRVNKETQATIYYNIAMIYIKEGKYFAALTKLQEAEQLISTKIINTESFTSQLLCSHSSPLSQIHVYNNMALLYQKTNNSTAAFEYFTKALNVDESDRIYKATVHHNTGLLHHSKREYKKALEQLSEAVKLAQDHSTLPKFKQHYDAVKKHLLSTNTYLE